MTTLNNLLALALIITIPLLVGCSPTKVLNVLNHDFGACKQKNVVFDAERELKADFYYTAKSPQCADDATPSSEVTSNVVVPTIVFIYGGSWRSGDKANYRFVANFFTKHGFNVAIPNYRLYPEVGYPEFVRDIETFFLWFADNAENMGFSTDTIHMIGHSAGAFNSAMYLFDEGYKKPITLTSYVGLAGPYDFFLPASDDKDYQDIFVKNGEHHNGESSLPASKLPHQDLHSVLQRSLILHGADDSVVTPKNAKNIAALLQASNIATDYKLYEDTGHVAMVSSLSGLPILRSQVTKDVLDFLIRAKK